MKNLDNLFLSVSNIIGTRITPENFRSKVKDVSSARGLTSKDMKEIIIEILAYLVEAEKNDKTSI